MGITSKSTIATGNMKYLKNTSWLMFDKLLRMGLGLFVGIWVARSLGPSDFGVLSYSLSFVGLFAFITTLGLDAIVVKKLVENKSETSKVSIEEILGATFGLKVFGAALLLLLMLTIAYFNPWLDSNNNSLLLPLISLMYIASSFNVIDFYFQATTQIKYVAISSIISAVISALLRVWLIYTDAALKWFAFAYVIDAVILAIFLIFFYISTPGKPTWKFNWTIAIGLLRKSWPLMLSGLVISIYMKIDQLIIHHIIGEFEVGVYSAAVRLSEVWYIIPVVISTVTFPAILNSKNVSNELYLDRMQKLYDFLFWVAVLISVPIVFTSDYIVQVLFGPEYSSASGILVVHIWSSLFVFLGVASTKWFVAEELQKYSLFRSLSGVFCNVILNFILIPKHGGYGAAIATLISQFFASYFFNCFSSRTQITFKLQSNAILLPFRRIGLKFNV